MRNSKISGFPFESETVEWKQSFGEWKDIVETCAAFATARGGVVYVGVSPKGNRIGIRIGQGTLEDIANKIKLNTDPPLFPAIDVKGLESSALVAIQVSETPVKPVWAFGRPIKRVGRTNQFLRRDEAQRLVEVTTGRTWDALICDKFTAKDIDMKTVRDYLQRAGMKASMPLDDFLKNIRMHSESGFCSAAVLMFGKCPQKFFVESQVKCARFKGTDSVYFLDERTFEGNLLQQLDEAIAFIVRNTRQAIRITGKPAHDVIPEYPDEAVREAVINALCHRNYAEVGTIQIRIFDDRLEVWNPGHLPHDLAIRKLY
ncbi:MAG: putative DNA binding domain-containing protein, partial [Candidatus Sumerlaeota bacterium]|nr:putative DNA binding domain-containing protein [Candidatus Sumerlaeota bacterium]